ncbi:hypothetical protein HDU77_009466 [Chytriomyces hyalinus]|nr:hypothetical protein HDU77_009466 [Chytriomyces hyalinus]
MFRQGRTRVFVSRPQEENCFMQFLLQLVSLLALVSAPLFVLYMQHSVGETGAAVEEALRSVVSLPSNKHAPPNSIVHVASHQVSPDLISDDAFGLQFEGAVRTRRKTEYCQWMEFSTDESHVERDEDGNERTVTRRTYSYSKNWISYTIPSFAFDQPAAHHNPLRDPFPSKSTTASFLKLGDYIVDGSVLESANDGWVFKKRYSSDAIEETSQSIASLESGFRYIGNGYFYSPYEQSGTEKFLRTAGMALEGSLLDFQIADAVNALFGSCSAGDLRVSFEAIVTTPAKGASVVGKLKSNNRIGIYTASNGVKIGLYENSAETSALSMLSKLLWSARKWLWAAYFATFLWSLGVVYFYRLKPEPSATPVMFSKSSDVYILLLESVALLLATVGMSKVVTSSLTLGLSLVLSGAALFAGSSSDRFRMFLTSKEKAD